MKTNESEFVIYKSIDGTIKVDALFSDENVWLTMEQMSALFNKSRSTINEHIVNIYKEEELEEKTTKRKIGNSDYSTKPTNYYNLDVIISVGYRVRSKQGIQFRQWATQRLKEYIIKGFVLNDERFKTGNSMNYFKELTERIREIRVSERVFYQQIKDIYTTSIDYDPNNAMTIKFFKEVQNKLLWAVSGKTAAELIYYRSNGTLPKMGLTFTNVSGTVRKSDIGIGKNYLTEEEITALKLIIEQFLAFAEAQAKSHKPMYMKDWIKKLSQVLEMNDKNILESAGKITHLKAIKKANKEYKLFNKKEKKSSLLESIKELDHDIKECAAEYKID